MTTTVPYLTLTEVAAKAPGRPHVSAVWRWCRKGVKGRNGERIHMNHVRMGGQIFVPEGGIEEFAKALADADAVYFGNETEITPPQRQRNSTVKQELRALGAL